MDGGYRGIIEEVGFYAGERQVMTEVLLHFLSGNRPPRSPRFGLNREVGDFSSICSRAISRTFFISY